MALPLLPKGYPAPDVAPKTVVPVPEAAKTLTQAEVIKALDQALPPLPEPITAVPKVEAPALT
jgi:hypothetical protein